MLYVHLRTLIQKPALCFFFPSPLCQFGNVIKGWYQVWPQHTAAETCPAFQKKKNPCVRYKNDIDLKTQREILQRFCQHNCVEITKVGFL